MAAYFTPFLSTILLLGLLILGLRSRLLALYPMFYFYLATVALCQLIRIAIINYYKSYYLPVYWYTQFVCVALGFGILWEIYGAVFRHFPGTARMARFLVSFALATVLLNTLIQIATAQSAGLSSVISLEKNMRLVQAGLLALGIALVIHYEIPIGKNAGGILYGYGAFVITSVLLLSLREHFGPSFYTWWDAGQVLSYRTILAVWLYTLHSYCPAPKVVASPAMAEDYYWLGKTTQTSLAKLKRSLGKALQP
ncbi:MAG TPA: hypothetical protein VMZ27_11565 [Candidatus Saccharimonadales bacterium]|nr:hypothetical protein [Candidatus Saccharimonadales bacterium]